MAVIAKYKFNSTLYADLIPEFNAEFTNYVVTDEATETDSEGNVIKTRIIEHDTLLPTLMRFGRVGVIGESTTDNRTDSLLKVLDINTNELTDCISMFRYNTNLTSIACEWDTSKVTTMGNMFYNCNNLTTLDVSNFNTSNVTTMASMFYNCNNLTSLDVSNFDTSNVTNMAYTFSNCKSLTSLDVSNFNTSNVTDMNNIFANTPLLTDIGMLYCSQSTINTLSSKISTPSTNVWVEGGMIDDLTSYDNVTYKAYYWEKEVLLNSPLLEGDKIVKKEGKLYHYHKMGSVVLNGSEDWTVSSYTLDNYIGFWFIPSIEGIIKKCDRFRVAIIDEWHNLSLDDFICTDTPSSVYNICIRIQKSKLATTDVNGFKQWLSENPTIAIYELANPYYELISNTSDDLSLSLLSEDTTISNNSLIPTNMNIKNNGMSTVAMNTSTKYTVAFDKDTDSSVTIDLCGSTIDTTDNVVEITTPSELANDEITFIGDCEVSNVRILEGSVSGDAIPKESFEGLKNSFEDEYIPENLLKNTVGRINDDGYSLVKELSGEYKDITIYQSDMTKTVRIILYKNGSYARGILVDTKIMHIKADAEEYIRYIAGSMYEAEVDGIKYNSLDEFNNKDIRVLGGDWTHLTEEDWNNLGKYKVEYKVTGKNKFDVSNVDKGQSSSGGIVVQDNNNYITREPITLKKNSDYVLSYDLGSVGAKVYLIPKSQFGELVSALTSNHLFNTNNDTEFYIQINDLPISEYTSFKDAYGKLGFNIQIEEGTTATEYEPYKEYTKTFYLNSPLLEGDTIEDVNGVATHVKRYGKVVFDGSEGWVKDTLTDLYTDNSFIMKFKQTNMGDDTQASTTTSDIGITNTLPSKSMNKDIYYNRTLDTSCYTSGWREHFICLKNTSSLSDAKQWLQANPTTVVYKLASPQYEPISTESILCDSYVNGHLDVDSNIPVEKVVFRNTRIENKSTACGEIRYLQPNTHYRVQFESDSEGYLTSVYLNSLLNNISVHKGLNILSITTSSTIVELALVLNGIGFNASNIQVVATERDNIGYFKGIQSSFEDKITEDNKYEVKVTLEDKNGVISNEFIYLNSPLLKGDKIEMYNGKLCHYHKMGKVILDGSENWVITTHSQLPSVNTTMFAIFHDEIGINANNNRLSLNDSFIDNTKNVENDIEGFILASQWWSARTKLIIRKSLSDLTNFKQWISKNPVTVVYELAEPYYEDITPIQNEFIITSIGESSFTIDSGAIPTDGEITYSVNVKLLNDLEESINNNTSSTDTDLSTILDDIINE